MKTMAILLLCACLAACGIKPSHVDAPKGVERDSFPHTYPAEQK
jgi:hypothetical protein